MAGHDHSPGYTPLMYFIYLILYNLYDIFCTFHKSDRTFLFLKFVVCGPIMDLYLFLVMPAFFTMILQITKNKIFINGKNSGLFCSRLFH